jgi:hypothetical protein
MPHVCALITIAMQLTCVVDRKIVCTDNEYLTQSFNLPACERVFFGQDGSGCFPYPTTTVELNRSGRIAAR